MCIQICASSAPRAQRASARPRSRGGGRRGPSRRRGSRSPRRAAPRPSPSTRCASPGGRGPTARPRRCPRPPSAPSTARSPAGPPCDRRLRRPRPGRGRRGGGATARRTRRRRARGSRRRPRPRRRRRASISALDQRRRSPSIVSEASGSWSGRAEPERVGVGDVVRGHLARELLGADPAARGRVVDLVVDVGDVGDERHVVALVREEALEPARRRRTAARCRRGCGCRPSARTRRCPPCCRDRARRAGDLAAAVSWSGSRARSAAYPAGATLLRERGYAGHMVDPLRSWAGRSLPLRDVRTVSARTLAGLVEEGFRTLPERYLGAARASTSPTTCASATWATPSRSAARSTARACARASAHAPAGRRHRDRRRRPGCACARRAERRRGVPRAHALRARRARQRGRASRACSGSPTAATR